MSAVLRRKCLLGALCALGSLAAGEVSGTPIYDYTLIAGPETILPGRTAPLNSTQGLGSPSLSNRTVAFRTANLDQGVYAGTQESELRIVADKNHLPANVNFHSFFTRFGSPQISGDDVAFTILHVGSGGRAEPYLETDGVFTPLPRQGSPVPPDDVRSFSQVFPVDFDTGVLGFLGTVGTSTNTESGYYRHDADGTRLIADQDTLLPGNSGTSFQQFDNLRLDGPNAAVAGKNGPGIFAERAGVYLFPSEGQPLVIAENTAPLPGQQGKPVNLRLNDLDNGLVLFSAAGAPGTGFDIFTGDGQTVTPLLTHTTSVSVGGEPSTTFSYLEGTGLDAGEVLFFGAPASAGGDTTAPGSGYFVVDSETPSLVKPVVRLGDTINGAVVTSVTTTHAGFDKGSVAFFARFDDGSEAILRADPIDLNSTPAFTLYGIEQVGTTPHLITLSPETAARDDLGVIAGLGNLEGLVFGGQNNKLYSVENRTDATASTLVEIDPFTKFIREVGTIGLDDSNTSPSSLGRSVSDLTFGPDGTLYATTRGAGSSGRLITVDLESGTGALVGRLPNQPRGLAYDPTTDKFLTYAGSLDLFEVDPTVIVPGTGGFLQTTDIGGSAGFSRLAATGDPETPLFTIGTNPNRLFSRNLNATSLVGSLGTSNQIRGLAAVPLTFNEPLPSPRDTALSGYSIVDGIALNDLASNFRDLPSIVLVHGWQPGCDSDANCDAAFEAAAVGPRSPEFPLANVRDHINLRAGIEKFFNSDEDFNVLTFSWRDAFTTDTLSRSQLKGVLDLAANAGFSLAEQLQLLLTTDDEPYTAPLHLIGHSAGAVASAWTANRLAALGNLDVAQLTILDAPPVFIKDNSAENFFNLVVSADAVRYLDNYFGSVFDGAFGSPIPGAAPGDGGLAVENLNHSQIHSIFYSARVVASEWVSPVLPSVFDKIPASELWRPDLPIRRVPGPPGALAQAAGPGWTRSTPTGSVSEVSDLVVGATAHSGLVIAEGSPVGISQQIRVPDNALFLAFEFFFLDEGDGDWLTLTFNNDLLWNFLGTNFAGDVVATMLVDVSAYAGEFGLLEFVLNSTGERNAEVYLGSFEFLVADADVSVSEPPALMLLLFGVALLSYRRRFGSLARAMMRT